MDILKLAKTLRETSYDTPEEEFGRFKKKASVALILSNEIQPEILFIHRTTRAGDPWSGHIALPGGGYESGDEDLIETAKRETFEEVGVDLNRGHYLGHLSRLQLKKLGAPIDYGLECHIFYLSEKPPLQISAGEVSEAFWVPQSEVFSAENITSKVFHFAKESHELPCIEILGKTIWGLTYVVLSHYQKIWGEELTPLPTYPLYL